MGKRILIIGAGPAGLGAGMALKGLDYRDWDIYEKEDHPGGLAASFRDSEGFTWDLGGHVLFSRDPFFLELFERIMEGEYFEHQREAWIWRRGRWIPYPFQNNIRYLPRREQASCLLGLLKERLRPSREEPRDFRDWSLRTFGKGIFECFMGPYNQKVWSYPLQEMDYGWIEDRVSVPSIARILRNTLLGLDDVAWGPNNVFKFPRKGGTGDIFRRMGAHFEEKIRYRREVVLVDADKRVVRTADGEEDGYDALISTMPLDHLAFIVKGEEAGTLREAARGLKSNQVTVVGIGLNRPNSSTRCWMYFPDGDVPFYRVTNFSHYSPFNVPQGDITRFSSLLCETSHLGDREEDEILEETLRGLALAGFMEEGEKPTSVFVRTLHKAYPVPTRDRDARLKAIGRFLEPRGIYSIGRFGTWRYEIGNMDHAVLMGYRLAQRLVEGPGKEGRL